MTEQELGKKYSQCVNVLIFIFPIVINSVKVAGDIVLFFLAMMGICIAVLQKLSPFTIKDIKVFSYITTGYFFALCLSVIFSGKAIELAHFLPRNFHFLFAPFIALTFYKAKINLNYVFAGIKVGLIVLGIIIINQLLSGVNRPSGVMNVAVFANLTVSMFFVVLVFFQQESFKQKMFTFLSLLSGLLVIISSGTRGAWFTFIILLGLFIFLLYKEKAELSNISKIILALMVTAILFFSGYKQYVNDRVYIAYKQTSNWFYGDDASSTIGLRLEMYNTAIDNIEDVPFFGYGYRTSNLVLFNNASSETGKDLKMLNHLHNAYLDSLYNGGIVLLGALLLLLFFPLKIFIKAISQNRYKPVYTAGVLLTVGFATHGLFNVLFGDVFINAFSKRAT